MLSHAFVSARLQYPYKAVGQALEVIPRTLAQNCGVNVIRVMTALQAKVRQTYCYLTVLAHPLRARQHANSDVLRPVHVGL